MKALVLEQVKDVKLREINVNQTLHPQDVRIKPLRVGICGSDIHYYLHGRIGNFILKEPMILGHETSGIVTEIGSEVSNLNIGDLVCMEPGIPSVYSPLYRKGMYNLDPSVRFWATPPVHGCLCESVVHPAQFTYKLPDNVSLEEGALVEPLAIGVYAAKKASIVPGDTALVMGAGTIGIVTGLAAFASGCSAVYITDVKKEKLNFVRTNYPRCMIPLSPEELGDTLCNKGVDIVFEASGSKKAIVEMTDYVGPGGKIVLIGMPTEPVPINIVAIEVKEVTITSVFRYAHIFDRALKYLSTDHINVDPLITHTFGFSKSVQAIQFAASMPSDAVKIMIDMEG